MLITSLGIFPLIFTKTLWDRFCYTSFHSSGNGSPEKLGNLLKSTFKKWWSWHLNTWSLTLESPSSWFQGSTSLMSSLLRTAAFRSTQAPNEWMQHTWCNLATRCFNKMATAWMPLLVWLFFSKCRAMVLRWPWSSILPSTAKRLDYQISSITVSSVEVLEQVHQPLWACFLLCKRIMITPVHAAAKSLLLCPTLCDPIDGSPPGSPAPVLDVRNHSCEQGRHSHEAYTKNNNKLLDIPKIVVTLDKVVTNVSLAR